MAVLSDAPDTLNGVTGPTALRYDIVDVFTDTPFAGNPLAVVHGADGLPDGVLHALAREFNLSETAFALPATQDGADYRVRIFTPTTELPFAGHPSIGTAWVLARDGVIAKGDIVQECGAGRLPISVDESGAELTGGSPVLGAVCDAEPLAAAVGLNPEDVDARGAPGRVGCGIDFTVLAVRPDAVARAVPDPVALRALDLGAGLMIVAVDGPDVHARVFAPGLGVTEDPATGSAALALGVWLVNRRVLPPIGGSGYYVSQGAEIGRPSVLDCHVDAMDSAAVRVTVRGGVVPIARGEIAVPGQ